MKRTIIISLVSCVILLAAGGIYYYLSSAADSSLPDSSAKSEEQITETEEQITVAEDGPSTNATIRFVETSEADPMLVGYWQNIENPNWFKAYYDDEDEDETGVFWGKEWDETDGTMEEDLSWHGNGWFKWQRTTIGILERYRMDISESEVPYTYKLKFKNDILEVIDTDRNKTYHFTKIR